jgi:hypothetical protein
MGITHLPGKRQAVLVDRFLNILHKRINARVQTALNPDERKKYATLAAAGRTHDDETKAFLLERGVDLEDKWFQEEITKLCEDVKRRAVKLNGIEEIKKALSEVELESVVSLALEAADAMSEAADD